MIEDAKSTPRASFFNHNTVDKLAKADTKLAVDGITYTYGNLGFRSKVGTYNEDVHGDDLISPDVPLPSLLDASFSVYMPLTLVSSPKQIPLQQQSVRDQLQSPHLLQPTAPVEARVALKEHDSRMDAAMLLVADGKMLISQGESAIKDAHQDVVATLTRMFGGASEFGSSTDNGARHRPATKSIGSSGPTLEAAMDGSSRPTSAHAAMDGSSSPTLDHVATSPVEAAMDGDNRARRRSTTKISGITLGPGSSGPTLDV